MSYCIENTETLSDTAELQNCQHLKKKKMVSILEQAWLGTEAQFLKGD